MIFSLAIINVNWERVCQNSHPVSDENRYIDRTKLGDSECLSTCVGFQIELKALWCFFPYLLRVQAHNYSVYIVILLIILDMRLYE